LYSATDGPQGITLARQHRPQVILMDIHLPGMSGLEALRILHQDPATRNIPVIAVSANAMPLDVVNGLSAGFFRYLTKPFKIDAFLEALDLALAMADTHLALQK
jgi:CheY-like chemotaxis protein